MDAHEYQEFESFECTVELFFDVVCTGRGSQSQIAGKQPLLQFCKNKKNKIFILLKNSAHVNIRQIDKGKTPISHILFVMLERQMQQIKFKRGIFDTYKQGYIGQYKQVYFNEVTLFDQQNNPIVSRKAQHHKAVAFLVLLN